MTATLHRRLLRLEAVEGRRAFAHLSDHELDARFRAELDAWLREEPAGVLVLPAGVEIADPEVERLVAEHRERAGSPAAAMVMLPGNGRDAGS